VTASRRRFPLVDSLRAVVAGSVLLLHTAGAADRLGPHALGAEYLQRLNVGVWISLLVGRLARRPGAWLRAEVGGLAVLCAIGVGYRLAIYGGDATHVTHLAAGNFLPGWLDLFSLGMGLAVVQVWLETRPDAPGIVRVIGRFPALCWLIAAVAFWWVATRWGLATSPDYSRWTRAQVLDEHWFFAVVAFAVMVPAVIGDTHRGRVRRLLGQRWMLWLGAVSYRVYLWQVPWLLELKRLGLEPGPVPVET
jgi:peptidoglycan/LPS O-acetylase OafA/YrhL